MIYQKLINHQNHLFINHFSIQSQEINFEGFACHLCLSIILSNYLKILILIDNQLIHQGLATF